MLSSSTPGWTCLGWQQLRCGYHAGDGGHAAAAERSHGSAQNCYKGVACSTKAACL